MSEQVNAYSAYDSVAFFNDDRYIRYILHPDADEGAYWESVAAQYPDKAIAMEEARVWMLLLNKQEKQTPVTGREEAWQQLTRRIGMDRQQNEDYFAPVKRVAAWVSGVAAMFVLFWVMSEWMQHGEQRYHTDFGKVTKIELPDESEVTLNGNSVIHYTRGWKSSRPRELWLQGEAFFHVKHVAVKNRWQQADSFRVHISGLNVTVTGTKFNIKSRRSEVEITLLEGGLRVEKTGDSGFVKWLHPGDVFLYDSVRQSTRSITSNVQSKSAWTRHELDLDGYTLEEILQILEDTYGYEITLRSPQLADKKLTGTIPSSSGEDILFVIQKVFNVSISRQGNRLIITKT